MTEMFRRNPKWTGGKIVLVTPIPPTWEGLMTCGANIQKLMSARISQEKLARMEKLTADHGGPNDFEYIKLLEPIYVADQDLSSQVGFDFYNRSLEDALIKEMEGYDQTQTITKLKNEVLVILGSEDFIKAEMLTAWTSKARFATLQGIGHSPFVECPTDFFKIVNEFLCP